MLSAIPASAGASRLDTFAGGVAGFDELAQAAHDAAVYNDNTDGWYRSLDTAYDRRIEAVRRATGRTMENPLRAAEAEDRARMIAPRPNVYSGPLDTPQEIYTADNPPPSVRRARDRFEAELRTIAEQYPDRATDLGIDRPIEQDALDVARQAGEALDRYAQSASGLAKWPALLYGGATGMVRDPIQATTMLIGAGPGAGRTVAARILNATMKEALINGVVEAALQPGVQAWRDKAGLPAGLEEALTNVAFAAGLGGAFGGMLQGGGELIGRALRGRTLEDTAAALAGNPDVPERVRAALSGDTAAARVELDEIRAALPAEARGALDHAEDLVAIDAVRPRAADAEVHDQALARAIDAAQGERAASMPVNPAQADRIAETLAPLPAALPAGKQPRSLTDFLIGIGGVMDQMGELTAATGGERVARRGQGTLVRADGIELDAARLRAAEAGYMDRQFGTPEDAMARSTVADLLTLVEEDLRGNRVLAGNDVAAADAIGEIEAARATIARDVTDVQRLAGPALDDATVIRALEISRDEGVALDEAVERAVMELPEPGAEPGASGRTGDIPPGWSDDELMAASANRAPDFDGGGIDDPGQPPEWSLQKQTPRSAPAKPAEVAYRFKTAKGSSYEIHSDGTTSRNKAARKDPGHEGDFGAKPQTARTVYTDANAGALSAAGMQGLGPKGARLVVKKGKATLATWNSKENRWGAADSARDIPIFDEPAIGRYPLELWKRVDDIPGYEQAYANMHAGNAITEIETRSPEGAESFFAERGLDDGIGDDELIPMDNGELMSKRELLDELDRADDEILLVEACRA